MSLYAYNKTGAPVALAAGHPIATLSPSAAPPAQGPSYNVTSELRPNLTVDPANGKVGGLAAGDYVLLQAQVTAGSVDFEWSSDPEYLTPGLTVNGPIPGPHALVGADHTAAGLTPGHVVRATGATTFAFGQAQHADLGGVGANDHHNQAHAVDGADHTAAGLTPGHVMRATAPTTFAFGQPQHADLGGIGATDHHNNANDPTSDEKGALAGTDGTPSASNEYVTNSDARLSDARTPTAHVLDGGLHTVAGLTPGHVMRATAPTAASFGQPQHADLGGVGANDHHNQSHVLDGGDHTVSGLTPGHVMRATAPTTAAFGQPQHGDLGGVGANDHHNQSHVLSGGDHTESGLTTGHVMQATGATTFGWAAPIGVYDTISRPDPTTVLVGTMIFNTDDGVPNWSNGSAWVDASGTPT